MTVKKRTAIISAIAAAAILGAGLYAASLLFKESLYSSRGSFGYWLTISSVIKSVPELSPTTPPRFYSSAGDGPKLPESAVTYSSSAARDDLERTIGGYLTSKGYTKRPDGDYMKGESIVAIEIQPQTGGNRVTVRENY